MLRFSSTTLQAVAIIGWCISLAVNPEIKNGFRLLNCILLLALVGVCTWKGTTGDVQKWRVGTIFYAIVLTYAFRTELALMHSQSEFFALPLTILLSIGFAGIVPLHRDYLLIASLIWAMLLSGRQSILPVGMNTGLATTLIFSSIVVGVGLNHAIIVNLRNTFALKEDFRRLSETDSLTGLPNRRAFTAQLRLACAEATQISTYLAMLDLDDFKSINDRFGHAVGDEVLMAMASGLRQLSPVLVAGRLGGEEFGIIVRGVKGVHVAAMLEQFLEEMRALHIRGAVFSFSAGVTQIKPAEPVVEALRRADQALYQAKGEGKACIRWHEPDIRPAAS